MKQLFKMAICLIALCSLHNGDVIAQSASNNGVQMMRLDPSQQIQDLIYRSIAQWQSYGYTVMTYNDFKAQRPLPSEIMDRFQENLVRYANRDFGNEGNSFVIYKSVGYGVEYTLQVIEDCAGQCEVPNKFYPADNYLLR